MAAINITSVDVLVGNATSFIDYGAPTDRFLSTVPHTKFYFVKLTGAGANSTPYLDGRTDNSGNGQRTFVLTNDAAFNELRAGYSTTGNAIRPNTQFNSGDINIAGARWHIYAVSFDGASLTAASIKAYLDKTTVGVMEALSQASLLDGGGTLNSDSTRNYQIGNRGTTRNRGLHGKVALVARIDRYITDVAEIQDVIDNGILNDPDFRFARANGTEYGPDALAPASVGSSVTSSSADLPPIVYLGESGATHALSGTAEARATITGSLTTGIQLSGTAEARATITGSLDTQSFMLLSGTAEGSATISGALTTGIQLSGTAEARATITGNLTSLAPPIVIRDDFERASVVVASSSVTGSGDAAVISLMPLSTYSEVWGANSRWVNPVARVDGVNGLRPTLRWLSYVSTGNGAADGYPFPSTRRMMFAPTPDGPWQYFDTTTPNAGGQYVEFRHNTPFEWDTVYVSRSRARTISGIGAKLDALRTTHGAKFQPSAVAAAYTPTAAMDGWAGHDFICDEFSTQTDGVGRTIPKTPLYSAVIDDPALQPAGGAAKRIAFVVGEVHASEDHASFIADAFLDAVLADTAWAQNVRRHYRIFVIRGVSAPGRYGGHSRSTYQSISSKDDPNRSFNSVTSLEAVVKPRTVMETLRAGARVHWGIDFHGAKDNIWALYRDNASRDRFAALLDTYEPGVIDPNGTTGTGFVAHWFALNGTTFSLTHETGDHVTVSGTQIANHGDYVVHTVSDLHDAGAFAVELSGTAVAATEISGDLTTSSPFADVSAVQQIPGFDQQAAAGIVASAAAGQLVPAFGQLATAGATVSGSAVQAVPAFGQDATAGATVSAAAGQAMPEFAQQASAGVVVSAAGSQQIPAFDQSALAGAAVTATVSQLIAAFGTSGLAAVTVSADAAQTIPAFGQYARLSQSDSVEASASQQMPAFGLSASVAVVSSAQHASVIPAFDQDATAGVTVAASASQQIPAFGQAAVAVAYVDAAAAQAMPAFGQQALIALDNSIRAQAAQLIPAFLQSATADAIASAVAGQTMPAFGQLATANLGAFVAVQVAQLMPAFPQSAAGAVTITAGAAQVVPAFGQSVMISAPRAAAADQQIPDFAQVFRCLAVLRPVPGSQTFILAKPANEVTEWELQ